MTIRVTKHVESETLHLPELKPMIGQDVDIVVTSANNGRDNAFWRSRSVDDLAREQGVGALSLRSGSEANWINAFEGFDEALDRWRSEEMETPDDKP